MPSQDPRQLNLFPLETDEKPKLMRSSVPTFSDNMSLPVHRWFRYSAGFSALWARDILQKSNEKNMTRVLDPFCGSGTVLLEAQRLGFNSIGIDAHKFVYEIAQAKLRWNIDIDSLIDGANNLKELTEKNYSQIYQPSTDQFPKLIQKCYPRDSLLRLNAIKDALSTVSLDSGVKQLLWLALVSILRSTSPAGTASWQYVLPEKSKSTVLDPFSAFDDKIVMMINDMRAMQACSSGTATLYGGDARDMRSIKDGWADIIITSPPYANNYDYADATRLEMTFMGIVDTWADLHDEIRKDLLHSCTQHVSKEKPELEAILQDPILKPIATDLEMKCKTLTYEKDQHRGKKKYDLMIAAYFQDMAQVWKEISRVTHKESEVYIVIGDSAPYGVHIPVEQWLGKLAIANGFTSYSFEKIRDRNIKWKNRKHRVPLKEGVLCVRR